MKNSIFLHFPSQVGLSDVGNFTSAFSLWAELARRFHHLFHLEANFGGGGGPAAVMTALLCVSRVCQTVRYLRVHPVKPSKDL